jgi:Na+-translocating ferredoxin:NAD+ oxidoreductase RnfA subunit
VNRHQQRLIACARQVADLPADEDEAVPQEGPLYLTWFALGHAAVLFYLAARALRALTPIEQTLIWGGGVAVIGFALTYLLLSRMREGLALAETVEVPTKRRGAG